MTSTSVGETMNRASTAEAARVMLDDDGDAVVAQVLENALAGSQSSDGI